MKNNNFNEANACDVVKNSNDIQTESVNKIINLTNNENMRKEQNLTKAEFYKMTEDLVESFRNVDIDSFVSEWLWSNTENNNDKYIREAYIFDRFGFKTDLIKFATKKFEVTHKAEEITAYHNETGEELNSSEIDCLNDYMYYKIKEDYYYNVQDIGLKEWIEFMEENDLVEDRVQVALMHAIEDEMVPKSYLDEYDNDWYVYDYLNSISQECFDEYKLKLEEEENKIA